MKPAKARALSRCPAFIFTIEVETCNGAWPVSAFVRFSFVRFSEERSRIRAPCCGT
jgi:hypothetical protein